MTALAVLGGVVLTVIIVYVTMRYLALMLISDESFFFGLKHYPVAWLMNVVGGFIVISAGWFFWWKLVGSHIHIHLA